MGKIKDVFRVSETQKTILSIENTDLPIVSINHKIKLVDGTIFTIRSFPMINRYPNNAPFNTTEVGIDCPIDFDVHVLVGQDVELIKDW